MKFILTGGGTGGHIFSAIATADEIKKRQPDAEIIFVGSKNYMEMDIVPKAGYKIVGMNIHRINRFNYWKNYVQFYEIPQSLIQSYRLIKKFKPDAVIGTGGFATGPILKMAQITGIPSFIQEHNAYPGVTTRLLAKKATRIHIAYKEIENFLKTNNLLLTGNPVRQDLLLNSIDKKFAKEKLGLDTDKKTLIIIGGSRGAEPINKIIVELIPKFIENNIQVLLQTGKKLFSKYKDIAKKDIHIIPFIDDMPSVLSAADVIISRSGAMTIAELALVGKAGILIPDTHSEQGHQDYNAMSLEKEKAGVYIQEKDLNNKLWDSIVKIFSDEKLQNDLEKNIKKFAFPDATKTIIDDVFNYLGVL